MELTGTRTSTVQPVIEGEASAIRGVRREAR